MLMVVMVICQLNDITSVRVWVLIDGCLPVALFAGQRCVFVIRSYAHAGDGVRPCTPVVIMIMVIQHRLFQSRQFLFFGNRIGVLLFTCSVVAVAHLLGVEWTGWMGENRHVWVWLHM